MRSLALISIALLWSGVLPIAGDATGLGQKSRRTAASPKRVTPGDAALSLTIPGDFAPLSKRDIDLKFPRGIAPSYAYGNRLLTATVAVTFTDGAATVEQLPEMLAGFEESMPKLMPGLRWLSREMVEINGHPWIFLAVTTPSGDDVIRSNIFVTASRGKAVLVNINAHLEEFERLGPQLRAIRDSLAIVREQP